MRRDLITTSGAATPLPAGNGERRSQAHHPGARQVVPHPGQSEARGQPGRHVRRQRGTEDARQIETQ